MQIDDKLIVGIDIGSNLSGICAVEMKSLRPVIIEYIDSRKGESLWLKADIAIKKLEQTLTNVIEKSHEYTEPSALYIEENPQRYRMGVSSAHTINIMAKFNALLTYAARKTMLTEPIYISVQSARKLCGIKGVSGQAAKEQAFDWSTYELSTSGYEWEKTKKGKICQWCYDIADSFVIARAGAKLQLDGLECIKAR